jgi:hypothetical protein
MPYIGNPAVDRFTATKTASVYSGDGSTVAFTLEHSVGADEDILVSVDGVIQEPSVAYAVSSGTTLTFTAAPSTNSGNNIFVYYLFRTIGTVTHPPTSALSATSGTFSTNVGIGNARTDGTLHVHSGSAGTVAASTQADDLVVENNLEGGITIITPDNQSARIRFTSPSTNTDVGGAIIFYRQNINKMNVGTTVAGGILDLQSGAGVSAINADANGAVTMPLQPAFLAQPSPQSNIAVNSHITVVFDTERFDQNADFASNTFTAPVTGKYQFNVTLLLVDIDSASNFYQLRLVTSNRALSVIMDTDFGQDNVYFTLTFAGLVDMDASDTAYVDIRQGSGTAQTDIDNSSTFSGYLVA